MRRRSACGQIDEAAFGALEPRLMLHAGLVISELMADNNSVLADSQGDYHDWIEIHNATDAGVDLDGWFLTDTAALLTRWEFPAVTIEANEYLVVFASGLDRRDPAAELHTNFNLDNDGEYLALVMPDGQSVAHQYSPQYPQQLVDYSYGVAETAIIADTLVAADGPVTTLVPGDDAMGLTWTQAAFNDETWSAGFGAVGYQIASATTTYADLIGADLEAEMFGQSASAYIRMPFDVADPTAFSAMTLRVQYDDGFAAYVNGQLVAEANAPASPAFDSPATGERPDEQAVVFEDFDVSAYRDALVVGPNVLAIHGLNASADDDDFLIAAELLVEVVVSGVAQYYTTPTPRAANVAGALGRVADTTFSVDRGFHDEPFSVVIATQTFGAEIRYTTDGSRPTATYGQVYGEPIAIETTTVLRAAAFLPGHIATDVDTQTYIFLEDVLEQTMPQGYPTTWGSWDADYDVDTDISDSAQYRARMLDGLTAIPTVSLALSADDMFGSVSGIYANPTRTGFSWERATSVELIEVDGREGFQVDAGIRVQGGASRTNSAKNSLSLRFRDIYGLGRLEYPLFDDSPVDRFDTLSLRAGYNNSWIHWSDVQRGQTQFLRDQWARDSLLAMGQVDAGAGIYVHLYINGLYWGLYNLTERPEASHYAEYWGGDDDEIDALNSGSAVDGSAGSWNSLQRQVAAAASGGISLSQYQQIAQKLDLVNLIDYMIVNHYGANQDWDSHNWRAAGGGADDVPWRIYSWDAERTLENPGSNRIGVNTSGKPSRLFHNLRQSPEFLILFADRLQKHFFNGGAMTPAATAERFLQRSREIDLAVIAESARWGDWRTGTAYTRDEYWITERERLLNQYFPVRSDPLLDQYRAADLYPDVEAAAYSVNAAPRHGGVIVSGDELTIDAPAGTIYYTLDGTDPRMPGGTVFPAAMVFDVDPILLTETTTVLARVLDGGEWSALLEATFHVDAATAETLAVTEVNYNPHDPTPAELAHDPDLNNDDFEFIELRNVSDRDLDLTGVRIVEGVVFDFSTAWVTELGPGELVVVVKDLAAFTLRYDKGRPLPVAGEYGDDSLANGGERVRILDGLGGVICDFTYDDEDAWPQRPDRMGASLEVIDVAGFRGDPHNWRASAEYGGSPGLPGSGPAGDVLINEVLTHTVLPDRDAIELHNTTPLPIDVGGWYLSDSSDNYRKFRIPDGTTIPAHGHVFFDEGDFNPSGGSGADDFALDSAHGDDVWLLEADGAGELTRFVDHVEFGAASNGESFGRWPDGSGGLYPMKATSLGQPNPGPRVGPVIITELHCRPGSDSELDDLEFIEIYNPTAETVDLTGWRLRKGVDFDFAPGAAIDPWGLLVVLSFDPADPGNAALLADFHAEYDVKPWVPLVGPYRGDPGADDPDRIQLQRPDDPPAEEPGFIPYLLEDEIDLDGASPLPAAAGGNGDSLHRLGPQRWGNDPASWAVAQPTPTTIPAGQVVLTDSSADPADAAVRFTTALSAFRGGVADSTLIRPAYADARQYVDITNTGSWPLTLFEIRIAAPDVTVDVPLTADAADDLVLQVGETQRFGLTYAPSLPTLQDATTQDFDLSAGLVILTSDTAAPAVDVRLRGESTFNSDINHDGVVNLGELGVLNVNFGKTSAAAGFDPTADINGDGMVNLADLGPLNAELGRQIASASAPQSSAAAPAPAAAAATPAAAAVDPPAATPALQDQGPAYCPYRAVTAPAPLVDRTTVAPESAVADTPTAAEPADRAGNSAEETLPVTVVATGETRLPAGESPTDAPPADACPAVLSDELDYASKLTAAP